MVESGDKKSAPKITKEDPQFLEGKLGPGMVEVWLFRSWPQFFNRFRSGLLRLVPQQLSVLGGRYSRKAE